MYEDNTACIEWGNHVIGGRERAKHIDIRKNFAHETIQNRQMRLIKEETSSQHADIFMKPLHLQQFIACRDGVCTVLDKQLVCGMCRYQHGWRSMGMRQ